MRDFFSRDIRFVIGLQNAVYELPLVDKTGKGSMRCNAQCARLTDQSWKIQSSSLSKAKGLKRNHQTFIKPKGHGLSGVYVTAGGGSTWLDGSELILYKAPRLVWRGAFLMGL